MLSIIYSYIFVYSYGGCHAFKYVLYKSSIIKCLWTYFMYINVNHLNIFCLKTTVQYIEIYTFSDNICFANFLCISIKVIIK